MSNNKQDRINNIKKLRVCPRHNMFIEGQIGVLIITGKGIGIFCNTTTGELRQARANKCGVWTLWQYAMGRLKGEYLVSQVPKLSIHMYNNVICAVALGWYDNDENLKYMVNHKNYLGTDNRAVNLELCTSKENNKHRDFRKAIIKIGIKTGKAIWIDGMAVKAKHAAFVMDNSQNDIHKLLEGFYKYVYMSC